MDESELRRRALESMLKKKDGKDDAKDGAKDDYVFKEDGEVEDGEVNAPTVTATVTAPAEKKSNWADDNKPPVEGTACAVCLLLLLLLLCVSSEFSCCP